jgi:hypothetical protein
MTNKENIERKIGLTFDFVNFLIDNPEDITKLPDSFNLEFIEKDFPRIESTQEEIAETEIFRKFVRVRNTFEFTK